MKQHKKLIVKRPRRNNAGYTLVELTFAAGVLAVAMGSIFGSLLTLAVTGDVAEGRTRATAGLASAMETVRLSPNVTQLQPMPMEVDGQIMAFSFEVIDAGGQAYPTPISQSAANTLPNPVELRITVVWQGLRGRQFTAQSSSMVRR